MGINITLFGQMITFTVFILFTMKFVWPPIKQAMSEREKRIQDGLASAERASHELELAKEQGAAHIREAKAQASDIIEKANRQGANLVDEARQEARAIAEREHAAAEARIEQAVSQARAELRREVSELAILGASRILEREVDPKAHQKMLDQLTEQV